jgi:hypothetical protein
MNVLNFNVFGNLLALSTAFPQLFVVPGTFLVDRDLFCQ